MTLHPHTEKLIREYCNKKQYPEATFLAIKEKIIVWSDIGEKIVRERIRNKVKKAV